MKRTDRREAWEQTGGKNKGGRQERGEGQEKGRRGE